MPPTTNGRQMRHQHARRRRQSGELFSDVNPATVETQFAWMQEYGLDGVALQRFSVDLLDKATLDARNIVLANVRQAAEDMGPRPSSCTTSAACRSRS